MGIDQVDAHEKLEGLVKGEFGEAARLQDILTVDGFKREILAMVVST